MRKRKILISIIAIIIIITIVIYKSDSFSRFKTNRSGTENLSVAEFNIKINNNLNNISIDLKDTITTNNYSDNYVIPGTNGDIVLVLDFSNVDVSSNYIISVGNTNLPTNLVLYSDSSYTTPLSTINGLFTVGSSTSITQHIYWKWEYLDEATSDANDNLYMNNNLSVPITISVTQYIGGGS